MRFTFTLALIILAPIAVAAQDAVFANPGFEEADADMPAGWGKAIHGEGFTLALDTEVAHTGGASARLDGDPGAADRSCFLQISQPFAPPKAVTLRFWYRGTGVSAAILRFRPVPGVAVEGDQYQTFNFTNDMPKDEWTERVFQTIVPPAAREADQIRAEVILYQRGSGSLWYDDVSVELLEDWQPEWRDAQSSLQCPWAPADGRTVLQSPPDFTWVAQMGAARYEWQLSRDAGFPQADIESATPPFNVYSHSRVLEPGEWHWRVAFETAGGDRSKWSPTRSFTVPGDAIPFPVPPADELLDRVPRDHPRIVATQATLADFRARKDGPSAEWWASFRGTCDSYAAADVDVEPDASLIYGFRDGPLTDEIIADGNKLRSAAGRATGRMHSLAFAYLISGDRKYADATIARMVEMASWAPDGITSYRNHDQVFRDITWKMAVAYDWCHDAMTQAQRDAVAAAVEARASVLYADFAEDSKPIYAYPYDSHGWTAVGFLGIIATALAHDAEAADEWFRFTATVYPPLLHPWGGEEGGWAQGVGYWKWSTAFAFWYKDALKSATGLDLYQKAWCVNNGWYKLYTHPPFNDRHHFGDGNHGPPGDTDRLNMARWAAAHQNPYFQWYANMLGGNRDGSYHGYYWYDDDLKARPPADIPQSRYFPDIGWVAMHGALYDPDDIMLLFKSSPYGSFNHSHADQNHFVLYAYGEPLLIDSGYYDWYGSPHDAGWTRHTKAHNDILVNGEGQPIFNKDATGEITAFETSLDYDYTCGDATTSYFGKLDRFERHIVFLRPDTFLIVDDIVAPEASTFTWCLHAEEEMTLGEDTVDVARGAAKLRVRFLEPAKLTMKQDDDFGFDPSGDRAKEWHAYIDTTEPAARQRFITLLTPHRATEELQEARASVTDSDGKLAIALQWPGGRTAEVTFDAGDDGRLTLAQVSNPRARAADAEIGRANMSAAGATISTASRMRAWAGEHLYWGTIEGDPGPRIATIDGDGKLAVGAQRVASGDLAWLGDRTNFLTVVPEGGVLTWSLKPLTSGPPLDARTTDAPPVDAVLWEAETYADHGGGTARSYSHREFLSGGKGVEQQVTGGAWLLWRVEVPEAGRYQLIVKGAAHEESADRLIEVDNEPLGGDHHVFRFPNTGGYGTTPQEWAHMTVCAADGTPLAIDFDAGEHEIKLTTVQRKLNLDTLALAPMPR